MKSLVICIVSFTAATVILGTPSYSQTPIPASPVDAIVWLENEGNTVRRNESNQVTEIIIDYVPDVFVVGDLDIFPNLEVLHINYTGSFYDHHMSGIARLTNLKTFYIYRCEEVSEAALAVLRYLPNLDTVKIVNCSSIYSLAALNSCQHLKHLIFSDNAHFDFEEFERLTIFEQLESIELSECTTLKDEHFEWIARAGKLRRLSISDCNEVTDAGMDRLAALADLKELELRRNLKIKGNSFATLPEGLEKLVIQSCRLDPDTVQQLGRFQQLKYLYISNAYETEPEDWSTLGTCPNLTELSVPRSLISDEHLAQMGNCKSLKLLDFDECDRISGKGLSALHGSTDLQTLRVSGCRRIDSEDLPAIAGFPNLNALFVSRTRIGNENFDSLRNLRKLTTLDLDGCKWIDDSAIDKIADIESLELLSVRRISRLSDDSLRSLSRLHNLRTLNMSQNTKITGDGFASFGPENELDSLDLIEFDALTASGLGNLMQLTRLTQLRIQCKNLTNEHVLALKGHPSLSSFDFDDMDKVDDRVYRRFYNSLPNYR